MSKDIKKMLINVDDDETRIVTITGSKLENLHIEQNHHNRIVGNIYHGIVVKVQTSFQAAFIEYGGERHGFLAFSDVNHQLFKSSSNKRGRPSIEHVLRPGQSVLVQVTRNEMGNKGVSLTTNISLPGRFLVFMPNSDKGGVSKKIEDAEARTRLKHLLEGICGEKDSAIIRTAGVNRSLSELKQDFLILRRKWNKIQKQYESTKNPQLVYEEEDVVVRTLRDFFIDDIAEIWIDHPEAFQRAREFFKANIPSKQKRLQFYLGERSLFSAHEVESQIEQLSSNLVLLPSGGSLVIDATEALVAIDVNSGRFNQGKDIEDTALRTNVEAAEEIARQLQLRNLGGLIVIDFIDMIAEKNRNIVVKTMEDCLQNDKAKWTLGTISQFGLLEMSRQRIATALSQETKTVCPTCGGMGMVLSIPSLSNAVLRKIRELATTEDATEIRSSISVELSNFLFNKKRQQLDEFEAEFGIKIVLIADVSVESGKLPTFELKTKTGTQTIVPEEEQHLRQKQDQEKGKAKRSRPPRKRDKPRSKSSVETEQTVQPEKEISSEPVETEQTVQPEKEISSEPVETKLPSEPPPEIPILFSSVHKPAPTDENNNAKRRSEDLQREKLKDVPPGTVLFSSVHRDDPQSEEEDHSNEVRTNTVERAEASQETVASDLEQDTNSMETSENEADAESDAEQAESPEEKTEKPVPKKNPPRKKTTTKSVKGRSTRATSKPKTAVTKTRSGATTTKSTAKKTAAQSEKAVKEENEGSTESESTTVKARAAKKKTTTRKKTASTAKRKTASTAKKKNVSAGQAEKLEDIE
ncbi:MAG: Rne/Rng family ribonuclease [SAR324 cluster bacterium]|nr:Rne/Rng family ribonuclease [SAR324 cluster bacterium]